MKTEFLLLGAVLVLSLIDRDFRPVPNDAVLETRGTPASHRGQTLASPAAGGMACLALPCQRLIPKPRHEIGIDLRALT